MRRSELSISLAGEGGGGDISIESDRLGQVHVALGSVMGCY